MDYGKVLALKAWPRECPDARLETAGPFHKFVERTEAAKV